MKKFLCILTAVMMLALCGCSAGNAEKPVADDDKKDEITVTWQDADTAQITFDEQTVNTLSFKQKDPDGAEFSVYDKDDKLIYSQESSKENRCFFSPIKTDSLKLTLKGGRDSVKSLTLGENDEKPDDDFRVTAYIIADNIQDKSALDSKSFDTITDVILFSCVKFDEDGNLNYDDSETVSGRKKLKTALANLKSVIGERDVNIYINILGPDADSGISDWNSQMKNKAQKHTKAFSNPELAVEISDLVNEYSLDGVFFDYEYPIKNKYWDAFSGFIIELNGELGGKKIGLAMADWDIGISKDAAEVVDMVEMMEYDLFDDNGDHSSFATAESGIDSFVKAGFDKEKLDLGIPFYGRPTDKDAVWYNYNEYSEKLGKYTNKLHIDSDGKDAYFNSYSLVYNKTSLAVDEQIGGVMVWHYNCDDFKNDDLSLFAAISSALKDRESL